MSKTYMAFLQLDHNLTIPYKEEERVISNHGGHRSSSRRYCKLKKEILISDIDKQIFLKELK